MHIRVLNQNTIDRIAAGEVVERPASIVKELVENSIDAGAEIITVEIENGGIRLIRVSDNGCGIQKEDIRTAFLRHATSKITEADDLEHIMTLGFRGEALSSIAAVSQVEVISKVPEETYGIRYRIEGGIEKGMEETGAPDGTVFTIRNLFYNVPARRKFLKTEMTESSHVQDVITHLALAHENISFRFISNGQVKLETGGNGSLKDIIYRIYGRDIAAHLISINAAQGQMQISGYLGEPVVTRGNRRYENYDLNGRFFENRSIFKAIEDSYHPYMMQHKYPFAILHIEMPPEFCDVNVHPGKMEVRFKSEQEIYGFVYDSISNVLKKHEMIPEIRSEELKSGNVPVITEKKKIDENLQINEIKETKEITETREYTPQEKYFLEEMKKRVQAYHSKAAEQKVQKVQKIQEVQEVHEEPPVQMTLWEDRILMEEHRKEFRIIGQLFRTYWLAEWKNEFLIIDQHAAHEKVLFEKIVKKFREETLATQYLTSPAVLHLNMAEERILQEHIDLFRHFGFELEAFGGSDYVLRGVPMELEGLADDNLFLEILDGFDENKREQDMTQSLELYLATRACKAAVKGNQIISGREMEELLDQLLQTENPYHCPHGRPTMIRMSKQELEKKFKRIVS